MKTEPTEALEAIKHCTWIAEDFNISDGFKNHEVVDEDDAINIANIAFQEGQSSPKIKQLEWDFYGLYYSAQTLFGTYTFEENEKNENVCDLRFGNLLLRKNIPVNEAKTAAQADFEKRIKECLE